MKKNIISVFVFFLSITSFSQKINDRASALSYTQEEPCNFKLLPENFRSDKEIALIAVSNCKSSFQIVSKSLKQD
jgi:hypothetical protein